MRNSKEALEVGVARNFLLTFPLNGLKGRGPIRAYEQHGAEIDALATAAAVIFYLLWKDKVPHH